MRVDRNFESLYLQMWGIQHQFTNLIIFIFMSQLLLKIASKWSGESCFAENLKHPKRASNEIHEYAVSEKYLSWWIARPRRNVASKHSSLIFQVFDNFLSWKFIREHVFESLSQMFLDKDQTVSNLKFANRTLIVKQNKIISLGNVKYWSKTPS